MDGECRRVTAEIAEIAESDKTTRRPFGAIPDRGGGLPQKSSESVLHLELLNQQIQVLTQGLDGEQVAVIYTGINGYLDDVPVADVKEFILKLRAYLRNSVSEFINGINTDKKLSPEGEEMLKKAIAAVK